MKKITVLLILLFLSSNSYSMKDAVLEELISNIHNKKFEVVEKFLKENEKSSAKDPEYFVVLLNYVEAKGVRKQAVVNKRKPPEGEIFLLNQKSKPSDSRVEEQIVYDKELIRSGVLKAKKGLESFPKRLDIHVGLISVAEKIEEWKIVGEQLVTILKISKKIDNKWAWGKINSMQGDPQSFMIQNVLYRTRAFYKLDSEKGDSQIEKVLLALVEHYPDLIYGHGNLGTLYMKKKEYEKSEKYFRQALKISENDEVVLSNLKKLEELKAPQ